MDHPKGLTIINRHHLMFQGWSLDSYTGLICAILVTIVLSVFLEFVNHITKRLMTSKNKSENTFTTKDRISMRIILSLLQMTRVLFAYLLMLSVMTLNVWLYTATICGAGIGFYFSGTLCDKNSPSENENTLYKRRTIPKKESGRSVDKNGDKTAMAAEPLLHYQLTACQSETIL